MALKLTLALPAATVAEAGTVRAALLSDTETTTPPVGAALDIVTVQVLTPPEANVLGLQASEVTVGAVRPIEAVWELPFKLAVTIAV